MIEKILATREAGYNLGNLGLFVLIAVYAFIVSLVIICLVRVGRYFSTAGKEQKLIRMEIGKLAEEVHLLRQELKETKSNSPPMIG